MNPLLLRVLIRSFVSILRPLIVGILLASVLAAGHAAGEGYFMRGKVIKIDSDGAMRIWVTSVHGLPREEQAPTGIDAPELPKVMATLELKSKAAAAGVRDSGLLGSRISLRGECEDLERTTRVPVIQVRLQVSRPWLQANLDPEDRAGSKGFQQIAAGVCPSERESRGIVECLPPPCSAPLLLATQFDRTKGTRCGSRTAVDSCGTVPAGGETVCSHPGDAVGRTENPTSLEKATRVADSMLPSRQSVPTRGPESGPGT